VALLVLLATPAPEGSLRPRLSCSFFGPTWSRPRRPPMEWEAAVSNAVAPPPATSDTVQSAEGWAAAVCRGKYRSIVQRSRRGWRPIGGPRRCLPATSISVWKDKCAELVTDRVHPIREHREALVLRAPRGSIWAKPRRGLPSRRSSMAKRCSRSGCSSLQQDRALDVAHQLLASCCSRSS